MNKVKLYFNVLLKSIIAGIAISIGGFCYLKIAEMGFPGAKVVGAMFFAIGLILICNFGFYLYTGKICYLIDEIKAKNGLSGSLSLVIGLLGNFIGCYIAGSLIHVTCVDNDFFASVADAKINDELLYLFIKGIFCGMLIYFAVEGFKASKQDVGKYIILILCVSGFIVCGFEHCIADMFYFSVAAKWNMGSFLATLFIVLGNTVGGLAIPFLRGLIHD